jgi:hypothetical protein
LNHGEDKITIQVTYKDIEKTLSGRVNDVWISINKFFTEFIPTFEISKKMVLAVDLQNLIKNCENIIAFAEESPYVLISRNKLTDNETLSLQLLARYIGKRLGIIESDTVSKEELQAKLGKSSKITSTRLSELVRNEIVAKTDDAEFKMTAFGVLQMERNILPKIISRISV